MLDLDCPKTIGGTFTHCWSRDAALDTEAKDEHGKLLFDHDKWLETGRDEYLPVKDGERLTKFTAKHMTSRQLAFVRDIAANEGGAMMCWWAVALCLSEVSGQGRQLRTTLDKGRERIMDCDMDAIHRQCPRLIDELGLRIIQEANGDPL